MQTLCGSLRRFDCMLSMSEGGPGGREKCSTGSGEPDGTAVAIEQSSADIAFEGSNALTQCRLAEV